MTSFLGTYYVSSSKSHVMFDNPWCATLQFAASTYDFIYNWTKIFMFVYSKSLATEIFMSVYSKNLATEIFMSVYSKNLSTKSSCMFTNRTFEIRVLADNSWCAILQFSASTYDLQFGSGRLDSTPMLIIICGLIFLTGQINAIRLSLIYIEINVQHTSCGNIIGAE
jgi:hypothetical protein